MNVKNGFKQRLTAGGRPPLGVWLMASSPSTAEAMAHCGFDFTVVDMEHAPNNVNDTLMLLRTLAGTPVESVVRLPSGDPIVVKQVLDVGAQTLMFPFVESAEQAKRLVASTRYPPAGTRGVAAMHRASRYGQVSNYFGHADEQVAVIVQLEKPEAVERLEDIAAVPGVDAIFIGPADLSASMGHLGDMGCDAVQAALQGAAKRAASINKPIGIIGANPAMVKTFVGYGYSFVAMNSDLGMMTNCAIEWIKEVAS